MSAIERLRDGSAHAADGDWDGYDGSGIHSYAPDFIPSCSVCAAIAAVDALHQAAKEYVQYHIEPTEQHTDPDSGWGSRALALAAAVSLVEGTASPQETARRWDGEPSAAERANPHHTGAPGDIS